MKYRKRPLEVEAMKFEYSTEGIALLKEFCGAALVSTNKLRHPLAVGEAEIATLEDGNVMTVKHIATEGDYVIKGTFGEFYPIKAHIFEMTYVSVDA